MNPAFRNILLVLHRWTGLTVGLVAMFLAVTGVAMVFRPQLQPAAERTLREVPACAARLPLDDLIARGRAAHPGSKLYQVELSDAGSGATVVRFADMQGVYLDSCSGAVLGEQNRWGGYFGLVEWLHRLRFVGNPDATELFGGSVSLILAIVMVGGGIALWWPATLRALKSSFKVKLRLKGRAFDLNLHRTVGIYVCLVLLMSTVTSLTFTFEWARRIVFAATQSPIPLRKPTGVGSGSLLPAETFLAKTLQLTPGASEIQILFPRKAGDAVEVQTLERDAPHANARTFIYLDPVSGALVRFEPYAKQSPGYRLYRWLGALHQGQVGIVMQLVLFLGILGVPVLGYTGIRSYLRGRFANKAS